MKHKRYTSPIWKILLLSLAIVLPGIWQSCDDDDEKFTPPAPNTHPTQTLLMYMPWSGNLTGYFRINIADMKQAISYGILEDERVLVFFATSPTQATLYELI